MKLSVYFMLSLVIISIRANAAGIKDFEKQFKLLPQPQKVELLTEKGINFNSLQSIFLEGGAEKPVMSGSLQSIPLATKAGIGVLTLSITESKDVPESKEGYILSVRNGQASVRSRGQAGLFYGCQTLLQLLEDAKDQSILIPSVKITDYPDIAYRAVHLDLKHHLDVARYYYQLIDRLAAIKINAVIIEFEDKLRYRKAPVVGSDNAISIEEFAAISRYGKDRNIEISPLVQGLGHASFILKHEQYKKLRDTISSDWSFDPMNPETYTLQFSLYEDAMAATPYGKYLHVGGDEVGNLGMSELSKKSGLTPIQLQMQWLNKVSEFATAHHRIPIFWDDMVFKLSDLYQTTWDPELPKQQVEDTWKKNEPRLEENISLFPKECIYMRWNYSDPDIPGNHKAVNWYKSHNLKVMAATAAQCISAMIPRNKSNFQPIKEFSRITAEKKLEGILCTAWDDCSPHSETYFRGFYDFSFFSWNYSDAKAEDVHALFRHRFYGPALSGENFNFQDQMERSIVFWEKALITDRDRENYHDDISLIDLPNADESGSWSEKYKLRIEQAKIALVEYGQVKRTLEQAMRINRRNDYNLAVMNQINEILSYPANLLLLLEKYDKASGDAKTTLKAEVLSYVKEFSVLRSRLEDVYSKTRIMSNPPGYILDQNHHHHLANGTANDDWMFVYELAINKKIGQW